MISTHAPHARRGCSPQHYIPDMVNFYSRASCEARLLVGDITGRRRRFLLTRLMRGAALPFRAYTLIWNISTHAPHARRGYQMNEMEVNFMNFYSRASCEARPGSASSEPFFFTFLLTRLMRGAADCDRDQGQRRKFLLTRLMRGAASIAYRMWPLWKFLLTRLMRGAAPLDGLDELIILISTHAPHARRGGDDPLAYPAYGDFYSRASCEARHQKPTRK